MPAQRRFDGEQCAQQRHVGGGEVATVISAYRFGAHAVTVAGAVLPAGLGASTKVAREQDHPAVGLPSRHSAAGSPAASAAPGSGAT